MKALVGAEDAILDFVLGIPLAEVVVQGQYCLAKVLQKKQVFIKESSSWTKSLDVSEGIGLYVLHSDACIQKVFDNGFVNAGSDPFDTLRHVNRPIDER